MAVFLTFFFLFEETEQDQYNDSTHYYGHGETVATSSFARLEVCLLAIPSCPMGTTPRKHAETISPTPMYANLDVQVRTETLTRAHYRFSKRNGMPTRLKTRKSHTSRRCIPLHAIAVVSSGSLRKGQRSCCVPNTNSSNFVARSKPLSDDRSMPTFFSRHPATGRQ